MRRASDFLLRNWPLKLGAVLLATVLYSGLVLGQNVRTWTGQLPVEAIRPPTDATLLSELAPVTLIRYRAPLDVGVLSPTSFRATVDLSNVEAQPGGPPVSVPITVLALDRSVQIVDFQPREAQVQLDPVAERQMPVNVVTSTVPDTVTVGPQQVDPSTVTIRGASSRVNAVAAVIARVPLDASALNVDRDVDLVPVDANGNEVPSVVVDPERARVRIAVARKLVTATLPIVPQLVGEPAAGYLITSVTLDPVTVTVSGEESTITQLQNAPTAPIDITGRTTDLEAEVSLALPSGVTVSGADTVRVALTVAQETGSQSYRVGVVLDNARPDLIYTQASLQVNVTLSGPIAALQAIDATQLATHADVGALGPGIHIVPLTLEPPPGVALVSIDPAEVSILIEAPPTPTPPPPTPVPTVAPTVAPTP